MVLGSQARPATLRWIVEPSVANKYRDAVGIQARRVECRIDDSQIEMLGEKRLLVRNSSFTLLIPFT